MTRKSDGLTTGAVSGLQYAFKLLELKVKTKPSETISFCSHFDSARKTFRNEIYSDYKANRSEAPDDLVPQFEYIENLFGI